MRHVIMRHGISSALSIWCILDYSSIQKLDELDDYYTITITLLLITNTEYVVFTFLLSTYYVLHKHARVRGLVGL